MNLTTKRGYELLDVASAFQKSMRRASEKYSVYFGLELFSKFRKYAWKRLLTVVAEDCEDYIIKDIAALFDFWYFVSDGGSKDKGRIFFTRAILIATKAYKNRDADVAQNFIYDKSKTIDNEVLSTLMQETDSTDKLELPEYTFDCHTKYGKMMGKTKRNFFKDEYEALQPKRKGLFDDLHITDD